MSARTMIALAGLLLCASPGAAHAQAADPKACAPSDRLRAGEGDPVAPPSTTGENLSEKLARTDGVICPPNVGPDMRLPTPQAGRTPVIPPHGSPGGDQSVQPK